MLKIPRLKARFPLRAIASAALSSLSLCALAIAVLSKPRVLLHKVGPDFYDLLQVPWVLGAMTGAFLFVWSWRAEAKWPAGIAGLLALAALSGVVLVIVLS
jgi:hypothetical protein